MESPQELYRRPATRFVADFIGMTDLLKGEVKNIQVNRLSVSAYDTLIELRAEDRCCPLPKPAWQNIPLTFLSPMIYFIASSS